MKQALILAGGKGTRLATRLAGRPKPLVDVCGVPLLERQVRALMRYGVEDIVVLVNHAADQIADFFSRHDDLKRHVRLIDDGQPLGTAGATLACFDALAAQFLVIYGDTLFDIDISRFVAAHNASGAAATLLLHPNDHPHDSDLVEVNEGGRVVAFHGYPHPEGAWLPNLVNAAFYAIDRTALEPWRGFKTPSDFAKDLFPAMVAAGAHLQGYRSFEYIKDLGTPERLDKVDLHLRDGVVARAARSQAQWCVFLDRDGTLNTPAGFIKQPEAFDLLPGAQQGVKLLNNAEYRVALVTNQPVIARGEASVETLHLIHRKLDTLLGQAGAYLDLTLYCPHHPDGGFAGEIPELKIKCACRKPEVGMIEAAAAELNADLAHCWMIGDSTADILAANRMGIRSVLVRTGEGGRDGKYSCAPDFVADDLESAARLIISMAPARAP